MKKPFHLFLLFSLSLFAENPVFGQFAGTCRDVLASAGGHFTQQNGTSFEFTLGEPVIETIGNGSNILSQGFHQPEICSFVSSTSDLAVAAGLLLFPNPTTGVLNWRFNNPSGITYKWQVLNAAGQLVSVLPASEDSAENKLDCKAFPAGTYFLLAQAEQGKVQFQVPFVKTDR